MIVEQLLKNVRADRGDDAPDRFTQARRPSNFLRLHSVDHDLWRQDAKGITECERFGQTRKVQGRDRVHITLSKHGLAEAPPSPRSWYTPNFRRIHNDRPFVALEKQRSFKTCAATIAKCDIGGQGRVCSHLRKDGCPDAIVTTQGVAKR